MRRFEPVLFAFFIAAWLVGLSSIAGWVDLSHYYALALYPLYTIAATNGWIFGNLYVVRVRRLDGPYRMPLRWAYYLGPLGAQYLLRAMAPKAVQQDAPFVPLYAVGVFTVLFLVPVVFRRVTPRPPNLDFGDGDSKK